LRNVNLAFRAWPVLPLLRENPFWLLFIASVEQVVPRQLYLLLPLACTILVLARVIYALAHSLLQRRGMLAPSLAIIVFCPVRLVAPLLLVSGRRRLDGWELVLVGLADIRGRRLVRSRDQLLHLSNWWLVLIILIRGGIILPDGAGSGLALNQRLNLSPLWPIRIFLFLIFVLLVSPQLLRRWLLLNWVSPQL
jgi:hypothetical protein